MTHAVLGHLTAACRSSPFLPPTLCYSSVGRLSLVDQTTFSHAPGPLHMLHLLPEVLFLLIISSQLLLRLQVLA